MARIRTIKPSFFQSEDVAVLPMRARLLWIGLWTQCDDQGRTKDNAKLIKAWIWPLDPVTLKEIEEDLETLAARGRIVRYQADGQAYLAIANWREHQSINKPTPSRIPPPPTLPNGSRSPTGTLPEDSGGERKGKERKGRDARELPEDSRTPEGGPGPEPPSKCPEHLDHPDPPPCGKCATARKAHEAWERERLRADAERRSAAAKQRAEANRLEIDACGMCDSTGYRAGRLCTHKIPARRPK